MLQNIEIDGKMAKVAFLDKIGGSFVDPKDAKIAIARFEDGSVSYLTPTDEGVTDGDADHQQRQ